MKNTVADNYERIRQRLIKRSKLDDIYEECDVMGVLLTIFPDIKPEHKLIFSTGKKKSNA